MINGVEHKIGLFANAMIAFLEKQYTSRLKLMKLLETFEHLSGSKINISKKQIPKFHYTLSQDIKKISQIWTVLCAVHTVFLYFVAAKKVYLVCFQKYVAVGELGKATDTLDATGIVILEKEFGKFE